MTIYRKVLCSERLPEYCKTCIFIDRYGNSSQFSVDRKDEVYDRMNRRFITERDLLIKYIYWLEEIEIPSEKDIIGMGHYYEALESEGDSLYHAYKQ